MLKPKQAAARSDLAGEKRGRESARGGGGLSSVTWVYISH